MLITVQALSAFVMVVALANALAVFHRMFNGTDKRNSIPYLVIMIVTALAAMFVYIYLNYIL